MIARRVIISAAIGDTAPKHAMRMMIAPPTRTSVFATTGNVFTKPRYAGRHFNGRAKVQGRHPCPFIKRLAAALSFSAVLRVSICIPYFDVRFLRRSQLVLDLGFRKGFDKRLVLLDSALALRV